MSPSLYIHIPFCLSKCSYCSFNSFAGQENLYDPYVKALSRELTVIVEQVSSPLPLKTLFFGGGTPTVLGPQRLVSLLYRVNQLFGFSSDVEISIEANPGTVDRAGLELLRAAGCNRLSLGVQSLCEEELRRLGRRHSVKDVWDSVAAAREAGFDNISLDLMYGLPEQSLDLWKATLENALRLSPEHLSMYQLTLEEGTPLYSRSRVGELGLPDEEAVLKMDQLNIELCESAGLYRYEISNYSHHDRQCRHNLNYWRNEPYFAAGAGAVSYVDGVRARRISDPHRYCSQIQQGKPIIEEHEKLAPDAAFRETVIMGLRLTKGVNREAITARFGLDVESYYGSTLEKLIAAGLVSLDADALCLTKKGLRYANLVMAELV